MQPLCFWGVAVSLPNTGWPSCDAKTANADFDRLIRAEKRACRFASCFVKRRLWKATNLQLVMSLPCEPIVKVSGQSEWKPLAARAAKAAKACLFPLLIFAYPLSISQTLSLRNWSLCPTSLHEEQRQQQHVAKHCDSLSPFENRKKLTKLF